MDENIVNFYITMQVARFMDNLQPPEHICEDSRGGVDRVGSGHLSSLIFLEIPTITILHDQEHKLIVFLRGVVFYNVLTFEFLHDFYLVVDIVQLLRIDLPNFGLVHLFDCIFVSLAIYS